MSAPCSVKACTDLENSVIWIGIAPLRLPKLVLKTLPGSMILTRIFCEANS